jgi:hypothetical protein
VEIPPPQCPSFPVIPLIPKQALRDSNTPIAFIMKRVKLHIAMPKFTTHETMEPISKVLTRKIQKIMLVECTFICLLKIPLACLGISEMNGIEGRWVEKFPL